jgi:DNA relaxase NicK
MKFDWYQATVPAHPIELVENLLRDLAPKGTVEHGKGRFNYLQSMTIKGADGERLACVLAGGPNGDPNVTASGDGTQDFVEAFRARYPYHRVTRCDAAEDFVSGHAWETLEGVCRSVVSDAQVKGRAIVPDAVEDGRTYYMGSPSSDVRVRLYEKTAEQRRHLPSFRWAEVPDGWVRLETQVRPKHITAKEFAASLEPSQIWGFTAWTTELAKRALDLDVERLSLRIRHESDDEHSLRMMCQQYGNVLERLKDDVGDWQCVGFSLGEIIKKLRG